MCEGGQSSEERRQKSAEGIFYGIAGRTDYDNAGFNQWFYRFEAG